MKALQAVFLFILFSIFSFYATAQNRIYIDVGAAKVKKSLIALPPFQPHDSSKNLRVGQALFQTVRNNLTVSGLFTFIKPDAYLEDVQTMGLKPKPAANGFDYKKWKVIGSEFLIRVGYKVVDHHLHLEAYVYYIPQAKVIFGKSYTGPLSAQRKLAHTFSNDVVKYLTNKPGIFNTKIVVARRGGNSQFKEIYVMDWDAKNAKKISNHRSLSISPAWSHDAKKISYTAFAYHPKSKTRNADLFTYDMTTKKRWLVSYRRGMNSGAAYFPDGSGMLLTLSQGGSPDIFWMSLNGKKIRPITRSLNKSMNVEPAISRDGKWIAFSSDRSGKPMIYTMKADGSHIDRITHAGKYNATPSWSPDGQTIAFAGFDKGHFDIFTIKRNKTGLKRLTSSKKRNGKWANNESPTFSPDGRHIMYVSDRTGKNQLYIINIDGTNERRITYDSYSYFKPKWSPFLDPAERSQLFSIR